MCTLASTFGAFIDITDMALIADAVPNAECVKCVTFLILWMECPCNSYSNVWFFSFYRVHYYLPSMWIEPWSPPAKRRVVHGPCSSQSFSTKYCLPTACLTARSLLILNKVETRATWRHSSFGDRQTSCLSTICCAISVRLCSANEEAATLTVSARVQY